VSCTRKVASTDSGDGALNNEKVWIHVPLNMLSAGPHVKHPLSWSLREWLNPQTRYRCILQQAATAAIGQKTNPSSHTSVSQCLRLHVLIRSVLSARPKAAAQKLESTKIASKERREVATGPVRASAGRSGRAACNAARDGDRTAQSCLTPVTVLQPPTGVSAAT
jgi:hypothetical protein